MWKKKKTSTSQINGKPIWNNRQNLSTPYKWLFLIDRLTGFWRPQERWPSAKDGLLLPAKSTYFIRKISWYKSRVYMAGCIRITWDACKTAANLASLLRDYLIGWGEGGKEAGKVFCKAWKAQGLFWLWNSIICVKEGSYHLKWNVGKAISFVSSDPKSGMRFGKPLKPKSSHHPSSLSWFFSWAYQVSV